MGAFIGRRRQGKIEYFDPRRGEEYFPDPTKKHTFSTVDKGLFVAESVPRRLLGGMGITYDPTIDLSDMEELISQSIGKTGPIAFAMCTPTFSEWESETLGFACIRKVGCSSCGYFPSDNTGIIRALLAMRGQKHKWREWAIGTCKGVKGSKRE